MYMYVQFVLKRIQLINLLLSFFSIQMFAGDTRKTQEVLTLWTSIYN